MGAHRVLVLVLACGLSAAACDLPRDKLGGGDPQPLDIDVEPVELEELCLPVFDPDTMAMTDSCDDGPSGSFSRG